VLAPVLVAVTSSLRLGSWLRARRLFETEADIAAGPVLRHVRQELLRQPAPASVPAMACAMR